MYVGAVSKNAVGIYFKFLTFLRVPFDCSVQNFHQCMVLSVTFITILFFKFLRDVGIVYFSSLVFRIPQLLVKYESWEEYLQVKSFVPLFERCELILVMLMFSVAIFLS